MNVIFAALIAGAVVCAALEPATAAMGGAGAESVLHSFGNGSDGSKPFAGLTALKGMLYGTTINGGAHGDGTVFAIDRKSGAETVLYSFCSLQDCADGEEPYGNLVAFKGQLYGTTFGGGSGQGGTIYKFDLKTGTVTIVYTFCSLQNCGDGGESLAGLTAMNGMLYGTAFIGGAHGFGDVFSLDPKTGAEKVLYSFCSLDNCADGNETLSNLLSLNGTLYGTTIIGGAHKYGTAFSVDPKTGALTVLYSFCSADGCTDGGAAESGLIAVNGALYGTTYGGGADDMGTVFSLDPATGAEAVVYSFCGKAGCADGSIPYAGLLDQSGTLYGMTTDGGAKGYGTVFSLDPKTGAETVLYSFCSRQDCADGEGSDASLIDMKGKLYGTTFFGGAYDLGTVFALKP